MKLVAKHILKGNIKLETGLHIGGAKSSLDIGGLDSPVIKTAKGVPYIPGSSLKGKIRSLLALKEGAKDIESESQELKQLFGYSDKKAMLIFRDAKLDTEVFKKLNFNKDLLASEYTEEKFENVIDRTTGKASNPRQIERVPAGAVFNFEIVLNQYSEDVKDLRAILKEGIALLNDDYLGGSGTRGYGQVKMEITEENKVEL